MRVLPARCTVILLLFVAVLPACREQGKKSGTSSVAGIPDHFELNLDDVFDLTKASTLTPELLESKLDSLAVVPREKLYKTVQISGQSAHWISAQSSPVHNPVYSIFQGGFQPTFTGVRWQGRELDNFYCTSPAEPDQKVPAALLESITTSLGKSHEYNSLLNQYEWTLAHYSVSAKYSTSVGKGDPVFLVTVRNKQVQPLATTPVPQGTWVHKSTVVPRGMTAGPLLTVDLDQFFDWDHVADAKVEDFDARMEALEKTAGLGLVRKSSDHGHARFFEPSSGIRPVKFTFYGGQYQAENLAAYVSWEPGGLLRQVELPFTMPDGKDPDAAQMIATLDKKFGVPHVVQQGIFHIWDTPLFQAIFFKYPQRPGYCFRLMQPRAGVRTASSRSSGSSSTAATTSTPATSSRNSVPDNGKTFKLRLAQTNGLLISQLSSGDEAGQVTKMTLTAVPNLQGQQSMLQFNQDVGGDMRRCLNEVYKLSLVRHQDLPIGHTLEIGFEDKYVDKDGPSAAVACSLLVESAMTGQQWDPLFAVTGDINADGSVQPIGGVRAKIRGATKGSCKMVAVPAKNEKAVADLLLLDGPAPLVGITVFGIKTFDDAVLLARQERPEALARALADFDAMRTVMLRDPRQIVPLLRTPHAAQRLQALLAAAPDCYSAKYLLAYVQGRTARTLSLGGSIEAAQGSAQAILSAIENGAASSMDKLKPDEVGSALSKLRSLRPTLDQRVWPYVDGVTDFGEVLRSAIINPIRSGARYQDVVQKADKTAAAANAAFRLLMNSAQVREELGL